MIYFHINLIYYKTIKLLVVLSKHALERFFPNVHPQVSTKTILPQGSIITKAAVERFFTNVHPQVSTKTTLPQGSIITKTTVKRFFTNVHPQVSTKTTLPQGSIITKTTVKGFSPMCILRCFPRPPFHSGVLSHYLIFFKIFLIPY